MCTVKWDRNKIPRERPRGRAWCERCTRVRRPRLRAPPHPSRSYRVRQRSREPSWLPRLPRSKGPRQTGKSKAARAHRRQRRAQNSPKSSRGGEARQVPPLHRSRCDWLCPPSLSLPWAGRRRGPGGKGRDWGGWAASRALSPGEGVTGSAHASAGRAQPARGRKSSEARRAVSRHRRCCRSSGPHPPQCPPPSAAPAPAVSRFTEGAPHPSPVPVVRAMAPRKNAKGGGGNSSSSSGSSSGGSSSPGAGTSGGSSSPGARRGQRSAEAGVWGRDAGWPRRLALRFHLPGSRRASPSSSASLLLLARGGGRARWARRADREPGRSWVRGLGLVAPRSPFQADPSPAGRSPEGDY